jgi:putative AdoMet-dependent methyltransferase
MPGEEFPASDFDSWAEAYDEDVLQANVFPFADYQRVLTAVVEVARARPGMRVLDLGVGTGNLARRFADMDCQVWGSDFSEAMLAKAQQKLPGARLVLHDLREPWPQELARRFDRIVSGYTFHHFQLDRKVALCQLLVREHLEPGGRLVIADISFPTTRALRDFATSVGDLWEEEPYWIADEALPALSEAGMHATYQQVSACAGVYQIEEP